MRWPWSGARETREAETREAYTDAIVRYLVGAAVGTGDTDIRGCGSLEIAAGLIGRAFACAKPVNAGRAARVLTPDCLQLMAREAVRRGEGLHVIEVGPMGLELVPVSTWDVTGGDVSRASWRYRCDLSGPTKLRTRNAAEADVISTRWATDPYRPWAGIDPLSLAHLSGQLHGKLEEALGQESGGPRGHIIPAPIGPGQTVDQVRTVIRNLKGSTGVIEWADTGFDDGGPAGRGPGWKPHRIGADPPEATVELHSVAVRVALAVCGIPPELASAKTDATSARESWRRFLHSTLVPLGKLWASEIRRKLDLQDDFGFDWSGLAASDVQGRARGFQSLTGGGMELERAARLTGFVE